VKLALTLAGALALLGGVAVVAAGCIAYSRLPGVADADALIDTIDAIAIGAFGALFGAGLIVCAGSGVETRRLSRRWNAKRRCLSPQIEGERPRLPQPNLGSSSPLA